MQITHRIALGAVALAAAATPATLLATASHASTAKPAPPVHRSAAAAPKPAPPVHRSAAAAPHQRRVSRTRAHAHKHLGARSADAAPAPAPAPSDGNDPIYAKYNADTTKLQQQDTDAQFEAGIPAWVACMNAAGLPTIATPSGVTAGGWTFGPATTPRAQYLESLAGSDASAQIQDTCMVKTYHLS